VLDRVDYVLLMSVNPGYGGQKFIRGTLEKIRELKELRTRYNRNYRIEVDGGVGAENTADLARAGADILVAGTSVFQTADAAEAFRKLQRIAHEALTQKV
jgi:ribulose-phosphate 3-epimerase